MRFAVSAPLLLATAAAFAAPIPPAPATPRGGFFVLDNCDEEFRGKAVYEDNLSSFDWSGKSQFRLGGFNNAGGIGCNHRVAVDVAAKAVWILEDAPMQVRKLDFTGKELLNLHNVKANSIAVDPNTGNLWVLTSSGTIYGEKTRIYSREGKQLAEHDFSGWDIAYDAKSKAFWIAGKHLYKVSAKQLAPPPPGELIVRRQITGWCAASVAINQKTGQAWVVSRKHPQVFPSKDELLGFDNGGTLQVTIPLDGNKESIFPFHASVDSRTGTVWVTMMRHEVRRYTEEGKADGVFKFHALAAQAEEATGGVWVFTNEGILRVSNKGKVLQHIKHKKATSEVWVSAY
jgi:hypothetical protein